MKHVSLKQRIVDIAGKRQTNVELLTDLDPEPGASRPVTFLKVAAADVDGLIEAATHYGESWYLREGAGAFFMLARKWDRIENALKKSGNYNILNAVVEDQRAEGLIDDIRDLRRYLMLVEAKLLELGKLPGEVEKGEPIIEGEQLQYLEEQAAAAAAAAPEPPKPLGPNETQCPKCGKREDWSGHNQDGIGSLPLPLRKDYRFMCDCGSAFRIVSTEPFSASILHPG